VGLLVSWRGARWPVMSSRYEPPEQAGRKPVADSASLWDALTSGADPTLLARGSTASPGGHPRTPDGPEPPGDLKAP